MCIAESLYFRDTGSSFHPLSILLNLSLIWPSYIKNTPQVNFPASLSQALLKRPETLDRRPHSSRVCPRQASVPGSQGGVSVTPWPSLCHQQPRTGMFYLGAAWGEVPKANNPQPPVHFPAIGVCVESVLPRPGRGHTWLLKSRYLGTLQGRLRTPISHA